MKKLILLILLLSLLITACGGNKQSGDMDSVSPLTSETTSEVISTTTSQESSDVTSTTTSATDELAPVEVQIEDGEIIRYYNEPIKRRLDFTIINKRNIGIDEGLRQLGKHYTFDVSNEDYVSEALDKITNRLLKNYFTLYTNYYIDGLLPFDTHRGGYKLVGKDIYPVARTYMTKYHKTDKEYEEQRYEGLCLYRYTHKTFTDDVAKEVLDNPTYNGKRYHYFEEDGKTYIDQSVAKSQGYVPYKTYDIDSTYKYNFYYYSFNYIVNNDKMDIVVYIDNDETNQFEQFSMEAVLENGEWRLAEFFDFEERVTVCDPQPVE